MTGTRSRQNVLPVLCALSLSLLLLMFYGDHYREITLTLCIITVSLLLIRRKSLHFSPPAVAFVVYLVICALSGINAISGKFYLKEFSKLLMGFCVFLFIISGKDNRKTFHFTALVLSLMAATFAIFSVELASTAFLRPLFDSLTGLTATDTGFESGTRLTGVFGNANVLASCLALGMLLSIHLIHSAGSSQCSVSLSLCTFCFILAFSMGATAFFALSCIAYLIFSGRDRGEVLLIMLEHFLPSAIFAFAAFPFFEKSGSFVPLLLMLASAGVSLCLFKLLHPRLLPIFESGRRSLAILLAALVLAAFYIIAALSITGAYSYSSTGSITRSLYLQPGRHSVTATCDGVLVLNVYSQTDSEVMTATRTGCLSCWLDSGKTVEFTIPEGSQVQHFVLWCSEGTTLKDVVIDGSTSIKLDYKLLPDFIANRLQGVLKSQNAVQRTVFFKDGLRLFAQNPILGGGPGCFESAACSVQSYYYETRYVHNHYIQLLVDCGVPGLAAYLVAFALLAFSLIRRRGQSSAVMATCLVMIAGHSAMEVSMSMSVYLPFAFGVFALIAADAPPIERRLLQAPVRWVCLGLGALFAALICLNLRADSMVNQSRSNYSSFMTALNRAAAMDPFEGNDYKMSFVYNSLFSSSSQYDEQAEKYARELSTVRSNTISSILLRYYLHRQQYDQAFSCAMSGAVSNRSNSQVWNEYFTIISSYLPASDLSPELAEQIMALYDAFNDANSYLLTPLTLSQDSLSYIQTVSALVN